MTVFNTFVISFRNHKQKYKIEYLQYKIERKKKINLEKLRK